MYLSPELVFVCFRYAVLPGSVCLEKGQNYTVKMSFPQYSSYSYHSSPHTLVDSVSVFHLYINYIYNSFRIKNIIYFTNYVQIKWSDLAIFYE